MRRAEGLRHLSFEELRSAELRVVDLQAEELKEQELRAEHLRAEKVKPSVTPSTAKRLKILAVCTMLGI